MKLLDDDFDGIREYDNPPPWWWLLGFFITILFAVGYFFYYHVGQGRSLQDEFRVAEAQLAQASTQQSAAQPAASGEDPQKKILAILADPAQQKRGQVLFQARCGACHGNQGQGSVGPNLVDEYWLHGGKPEQVYLVISDGFPQGGMPPWKAQLSSDEIWAVVAYIKHLAHTTPPNSKAPQGKIEKD
ncbi:c-type cytochrome [Bdellovibrionota bacterium FG-2]